MRRVIRYFSELLATLKRINDNLIGIRVQLTALREDTERLAKCTTNKFGYDKTSIRTAGPHD
jgi:hypothetical protein